MKRIVNEKSLRNSVSANEGDNTNEVISLRLPSAWMVQLVFKEGFLVFKSRDGEKSMFVRSLAEILIL